ncbi:MAG TPA: U32 family peptidase [Tenuifilaceae bacterium]|nr:U32 family peptidase [Tenuifilaceae bacterium]
MTSLELLSPAKDLKTGMAAITHGADAVYIAAYRFGAREKAGNSIEDIGKLTEFAHQYFARVYVTVNTIIFDNELDEVQNLINELYRVGVDAIIVQDLAILSMNIPPIALHASTQMHTNTLAKLKFLEQCGFQRVVLPRELTLSEIGSYCGSTSLEIEAFIHGALCVSYSGQCYMSQRITGRSANRGECAQPCRSSYDLVDEHGKILVRNKHLLSLKDLNLTSQIEQLVDAGVTSFKIEGRLKDITYVKNITTHYNKILNSIISRRSEFRRASSGVCECSFDADPEKTFNRGYTQHFINGRTVNQTSFHTQKSVGKPIGIVARVNADYFEINSYEAVHPGDGLCYFTTIGQLSGMLVNRVMGNRIYPRNNPTGLSEGDTIYRNSDIEFEKQLNGKSARRWVGVRIAVSDNNGNLKFSATDSDGIAVEYTLNNNFDEAKDKARSVEMLIRQLSKSGDSIFRVDGVAVQDYTTPKFIPISTVNEARRMLLNNLILERLKQHTRPFRGKYFPAVLYPEQAITYKGNISNTASQDFLLKHGVTSIVEAVEISAPKGAYELMVTRYCIKFELGLCPSKQKASPTGQLYLQNSSTLYPLVFDCNECQMKVMSPK